MPTGIDIQAQINQLLEAQNKLLEQSAKLTRDQVSLTKDMVNAMQSANWSGATKDVQAVQQAVQQASETTKNYGTTNQDVYLQVQQALKDALKTEEGLGKGFDDLTTKVKKFSVASSSLDGFVQGLRMTANLMHNVGAAGLGLVGSLAHIGASILAIPFRLLSGLIHMSDSGGGSNELQQALEEIRKEFGSLKETSGRAIIDIARNMKGELANTGLSVTRVFGNLAERLKTIQEYAHNLGPLFGVLAGQFVKNSEAIGAYYKGLGLTAEAQKAVAARSFALGTSVTEELRQIANYSLQLSKAFGGAAGSAKEISRDIGTLMADFRHFGGMSTKEIGQAVVYFRRLGVEVSKVLGVLDRYDNFEDAAQGAAHLSQAFNLNVDALELMKAQNPAQRVEMLRKAFFAAGRSIEGMTRQERALLAQQTGLDDSTLDLVFSMKNQGLSYDQVTRKADTAHKKQLTQAEALSRLADSIERLTKSGSGMTGGFLERFLKGFGEGITRSQEFRNIMKNLRIDLNATWRAGIQVGQAFVQMFPGIRDILQGIADLFEPRRFKNMLKRVTDTFKDFFKNLTNNPGTAITGPGGLLERLKNDFFSWFQTNNSNGRRVLEGFRAFFIALAHITGGLLKSAIQGLTAGIQYVVDLLSGRRHLGLGGAAGGATNFVSQLLEPIISAFVQAGPGLWNAVKDLFGELLKKAGPWILHNGLKALGILTGPALIGFFGRGIATALGGGVVSGLVDFFKGGGVTRAFNSVQGLFQRRAEDVTQHARLLTPPPVPAGARGNGTAAAIRSAGETANAATETRANWGRAAVMLVLIGAFIAATVYLLMPRLLEVAEQIKAKGLSAQQVQTAALALVATAGALALVAVAANMTLRAAQSVQWGALGRAAIGLGIIAVFAGAMVLGAYGIVNAFKGFRLEDIGKAVAMMAAMSVFMTAVAGITVVAGLVGGVILATKGAALLAIGAGLAAMAGVTEVMVREGIRVMEAVNSFTPGPGFVEKAKAFAAIMTSIGSFASSIATISASTRPGILEFTSGSEQQRRTLDSVKGVIQAMSTSLIGIVNVVRDSIQQLSGSEQQVRSAEMLGNMLNAVAGLAKAIQPPSEALAQPDILTGLHRLIGGEGPERAISLMTDYVNTVSNQLRLFIVAIAGILTGPLAAGLSESQMRAAQAIPGILNAVGELAKNLRPSAALVDVSRNARGISANLGAVGDLVQSTLRAITSSDLFTRIATLISSITERVGDLGPNQLKTVQAIAPILGPVFQTIAQITGVIGTLAVPSQGPTQNNTAAITAMTGLIQTFFTSIQTSLPALVTSMRAAFAGLNPTEAQALAKGMEGLGAFFTIIGGVPRILESFKGAAGPSTTNTVDSADISRVLTNLLYLLNGTNGSSGLVRILELLVGSLNGITSQIGNPAEFASKINSLKAVFEVIGSVPTIIENLRRLSSGTNAAVPANIMEQPLMLLSNIINGLTATTIGGMPNLLLNNQLRAKLATLTGVSDAQKTQITAALAAVTDITSQVGTRLRTATTDTGADITGSLTTMNTTLTQLAQQFDSTTPGTIGANLAVFGERIIHTATLIHDSGIEHMTATVIGMVTEVNNLSKNIRSLQPIEIETSLKSLGENLGLGSSGNYTIQNRNFSVNIDFAVRFSNEGLDNFELALLRRSGPHPTRITHGNLER